MKNTPTLPHQPGYEPMEFTQEQIVEFLYEMFAQDTIDMDRLNTLILKANTGKWNKDEAMAGLVDRLMQMKHVGIRIDALLGKPRTA